MHQEYNMNLHYLAALLAHPYLDVLEARQTDLKLGKFGQYMVDLNNVCEDSQPSRDVYNL